MDKQEQELYNKIYDIMKIALTILLILAFWNLKAQEKIRQTHRLVKHECQICGVDFWLCEKIPEETYYPYGDFGFYQSNAIFECYRDDDRQRAGKSTNLTIGNGVYICDDCYKKYIEPLKQAFQKQFDATWSKALKDSIASRKRYDKQRKDAEIEALQNQIKNLREQMEIKQGKRKPKVDSSESKYWNNKNWIINPTDSMVIHSSLIGSAVKEWKWNKNDTLYVDSTVNIKIVKHKN